MARTSIPSKRSSSCGRSAFCEVRRRQHAPKSRVAAPECELRPAARSRFFFGRSARSPRNSPGPFRSRRFLLLLFFCGRRRVSELIDLLACKVDGLRCGFRASPLHELRSCQPQLDKPTDGLGAVRFVGLPRCPSVHISAAIRTKAGLPSNWGLAQWPACLSLFRTTFLRDAFIFLGIIPKEGNDLPEDRAYCSSVRGLSQASPFSSSVTLVQKQFRFTSPLTPARRTRYNKAEQPWRCPMLRLLFRSEANSPRRSKASICARRSMLLRAAVITCPGMDRHAVLVFHDQPLTDEQQIAFTRSLGKIELNTANNVTRLDQRRLSIEMSDISNLDQHSNMLARDVVPARSISAIGCGIRIFRSSRYRRDPRRCPPASFRPLARQYRNAGGYARRLRRARPRDQGRDRGYRSPRRTPVLPRPARLYGISPRRNM